MADCLSGFSDSRALRGGARTYGDEQHTSLGARPGTHPAHLLRSHGGQGAHARRARPVHMHIRPDSVTTYPARALVKGD
ncbi:hypothetical protein GCM10010298_73690 [Streptomyces microflavus]|nr:hypothetical protein GCM10010298_73690 [Streptomyces microflavus]